MAFFLLSISLSSTRKSLVQFKFIEEIAIFHLIKFSTSFFKCHPPLWHCCKNNNNFKELNPLVSIWHLPSETSECHMLCCKYMMLQNYTSFQLCSPLILSFSTLSLHKWKFIKFFRVIYHVNLLTRYDNVKFFRHPAIKLFIIFHSMS